MIRPPFIFGAQYYRAPTPDSRCWKEDLKNMKGFGFNAVKFWVQWRWSHRRPDHFIFDDLDRLMDLAAQNELGVTLNVIFDVAPSWLFRKYPDAKMITASGEVIEPRAEGHRQIGGSPGPCYHHPGALGARQLFFRQVIDHFKDHPALSMWDVWNEPEQGFPYRSPDVKNMVCYCRYCREQFVGWLREKYTTLETLNKIWGRCYDAWDEIEMPMNPATIQDYVDWREFHLDKMTQEAQWRLAMVEERDPAHIRYLHVVPNTMSCFNAVTCVDDFELAKPCQVFAATVNSGPVMASQVISAGRGKICYNVESHINFGSTNMHQRILNLPEVLQELLPQIGFGIKGFLFWQYRSESLGLEAPAWGLVRSNGTPRPVTQALKTFWEVLSPHVESLMACVPSSPRIGIWKSRKNEIFHFCMNGNLQSITDSVEGYVKTLYWENYPFLIVSGQMLEQGELGDLKLLIIPSGYYLTEAEARSLDAWVRNGGVLLAEAHLAGYNGTTGRHSEIVPGCDLAKAWGFEELDSTSSYHMNLEQSEPFEGKLADDVRKALSVGLPTGGQYFPIHRPDGTIIWGANRYAVLGGSDLVCEGQFNSDGPCLISKSIGRGKVFYCATNLGEAFKHDEKGLRQIVRAVAAIAGVSPTLEVNQPHAAVHVDLLLDGQEPQYVLVINRQTKYQEITFNATETWKGLFTGEQWNMKNKENRSIAPNFIELFQIIRM
jgi:beta-galactosidase